VQVQISTRTLAQALGLNKDTVTRALDRLRAAEIVVRAKRDDATGKSKLVLRVPESLHSNPALPEGERRTPRGARARQSSADQLSLLE
jgi:DNA-binding transcriptional MocR family regulator